MIRQHWHTSSIISVVVLGCGTAAPPPEAEEERGGAAYTIWTDSMELFFEHPPLLAGQPGETWAIHLTALRTFAPVTEGVLTLRFIAADGREHAVTDETPARPGIYTTAPSFDRAGTYRLEVAFEGPQVRDRFDAGTVRVFGSVDEIPEVEEAGTGAAISFLKEQQWPIEFATEPAVRRPVARSIRAPGEVVPSANRMATVTAPVDGIVRPRANRGAPVPGEWVSAAQRLVVLAPTGGTDTYATLRAREQRLSREVARVERLLEIEAVPARRLEEAQHELSVVRAALDAMGAGPGEGYEFTVRTPIAGVVETRHVAAGARVTAGQPLFTIVDPRVVWLTAHVPAMAAEVATGTKSATFTLEGGSDVYETSRVLSVGRVIDPERRTLPVLFSVDNSDQRIKIGLLADVHLLQDEAVEGIAIPAAGVRDEDGIPVAYVQTGGESFERRVLTLGPGDGAWIIVEQGVALGERVVTVGAYQVRLSSLSTSELADHGHPH